MATSSPNPDKSVTPSSPIPGSSRRSRRRRRPLGVLRRHRAFCVVVGVAALLRLVVMLGYPPAMFFNDSYSYLNDVVTGQPDPMRSNGYPFFLWLLMPTHSFNVVTGIQALMGLAMGVLIYAVLRRRGLAWWGATLCALPVLFDVYELQLEHMISSDVLFFTLVTVAVVLLVWWDTPPVAAVVVAGLLVGYATTVRDIGEPMLVLFVIGMIARRMGWRRIVATTAAGAAPIAAYLIWYHSATGQFAMDDAGPFLYGRVQTFAECSQMNPPPDLRPLCDPRSPADRPEAEDYIWAGDQPLMELTHGDNSENEFTPRLSKLSDSFARLAIESQPLAYAEAVGRDILTPFDWNRVGASGSLESSLGNVTGTGALFQFEPTEPGLPSFVTPATGGYQATRTFGGASLGLPRVVQPWARFLWLYQHVYVRGPIVAAILVLGFAGVVLRFRRRAWRDRRWGGLGLLPWLIGATLIIVPPLSTGYSYRYLLAAVPFLCLAAGLAFVGPGSPATWFRAVRNRGSGSPAAQADAGQRR